MAEPTSKQCGECELVKDIEQFARRTGRPSGRQAMCRDCFRAYMREYRKPGNEPGPQAILRPKPVFQPPSPEEVVRRQTAERQRRLAYRQKRKDFIRERMREWRAQNPDATRRASHKRRALMVAARVGPIDEQALPTGFCGLCSEPIDEALSWPDPMSKSLDHIIPLSLGGTHEQDNVQWAHLRCNLRKGARLTG